MKIKLNAAILVVSVGLLCVVGVEGRKLRADYTERLLAGEQSACKALVNKPTTCDSDGPAPQCTPYRSVANCPVDESFQTYIQSRFKLVEQDRDAIASSGYWFPYLDDKLAAYKFTASIGLRPPEIYSCSSVLSSLLSFKPTDSAVQGFVIRATDRHSNHGVYVLPEGFGGNEIIRGIDMSAEDVISDLKTMGVTKFVVEEYVGSSTRLPMEFKFHMFEGQVASISVVANRGSDCACWAEMDSKQNRLDKYGCFTAATEETKPLDGECTGIDFQVGANKAYPMKGLDICSDFQIEQCLLDDMIAVATKASEAIGVYARVDLFLGADDSIYVQEYSSNHMHGIRHCSAEIDENGCIDPCFQGRMWKNASGSSAFGGPVTPMPVGLKSWINLANDDDKCIDIEETKMSRFSATTCITPSPISQTTTSSPVTTPSEAPIAQAPPTTGITFEPSTKPSAASVVAESDSAPIAESLAPSVPPLPSSAPSNAPTTTMSPSNAPSESPSALPSIVPLSPVALPKCVGAKAGWWGDPHFATFDGIKWDCQVKSEMTIIKSVSNAGVNTEIQGRFIQHWKKQKVALTKSLLIQEGDIKIQLNVLEDFANNSKYSDGMTLSEKMSSDTKMINRCPIDLRVNGVQRHIGQGSGISDEVVVQQEGNDKIKIIFRESTLTVTATVRYSKYWTCHFNTNVCIPDSAEFENNMIGLLGTPDGIRSNEFINPDRSTTVIRSGDYRRAPAYNYCGQYCSSKVSDLRFDYADYEDHAMYDFCTKDPFPGEFSGITTREECPAVWDACNGDVECLTEGASCDVQDAVAGQANEADRADNFCKTDADCINGSCGENKICQCDAAFLDCDGNGKNGCERRNHDASFTCNEIRPKTCTFFEGFEDFKNKDLWSQFTSTSKIGGEYATTFLGRFINHGRPRFTFDVGTAASKVLLTFDFLRFDSWDAGNKGSDDRFKSFIFSGGEKLEVDYGQFHWWGQGKHRNGTAEDIAWVLDPISENVQMSGTGSQQDEIFSITMDIPKKYLVDGVLDIEFHAAIDQDKNDESAGIDNILVTACP